MYNMFFCYIDSGSGSYIIQVIIALILGIGYSFKLYWAKIKSIFSKNSEKIENESDF